MSSPLVAIATVGTAGASVAANIVGSKAQQKQIRDQVRAAQQQQQMMTAAMIPQGPKPVSSAGIILGVVTGMALALGGIGFFFYKASKS